MAIVDPFSKAPAADRAGVVDPFKPAAPAPSEAPASPKLKRTWSEAVKDTGLGIVQGAVNTISGLKDAQDSFGPLAPVRAGISALRRLAPDAPLPSLPTSDTIGQRIAGRITGTRLPETTTAETAQAASRAVSENLSPALQQDRAELDQAEGFAGTVGTLLKRPRLLGQFTAEQVPNLLTMGAGTRAAGASAARSAVSRALTGGATEAAAAAAGREAAKKAGTQFVTAANPVMEAGPASLQAQQDALSLPDEVWQQDARYRGMVDRGVDPAAAKRELASDAGAVARLVGLAAGYAGGRVSAPFEAEVFNRTLPGGARALLTRPGLARVGGGVAREATEEAVTEGASQFGSNLGVREIDSTRGLLEGVPEAAAVGATLGGVLGGGMGVVGTAVGEGQATDGRPPPLPAAPPPIPPPPIPPERLALPKPETITVSPDGTAEIGSQRPEVFADPEMRFPQGRGMSAPFLRRPGEPAPRFPDAQPGSLSAVANDLDAAGATAAIGPATGGLADSVGDTGPASAPAPAPQAAPRWVDTSTGEMREPTDVEIRAEIHDRVNAFQGSTGGAARPAMRPGIRRALGLPERQFNIAWDEVVRERKRGLTAPDVVSSPAAEPAAADATAPAASFEDRIREQVDENARRRREVLGQPEPAAADAAAQVPTDQLAPAEVPEPEPEAGADPAVVEEAPVERATAPEPDDPQPLELATAMQAEGLEESAAPAATAPAAPAVQGESEGEEAPAAPLEQDSQASSSSEASAPSALAPHDESGTSAPIVSEPAEAADPVAAAETPDAEGVPPAAAEAAVEATAVQEQPEPAGGAGAAAPAAKTRVVKGKRQYVPAAPETLAAYYHPGRMVPSYGNQHDRVLKFEPRKGMAGWRVQVVHVNEDGSPIPGAEPRWHATTPGDRELRAVLGEPQAPPKKAGAAKPKAKAGQDPAPAPSAPAAAADATAPAEDPVAQAAAAAATSPTNDRPEPTAAQKDAGNYAKGHLRIDGLDVSIENPAGSRRRPEWPALAHAYGYVRGTEGKDGDHVDVFLSDRATDTSLPVFVVDQNNQAGRFDEHKVMVGFPDEAAARAGYLANYSPGWNGLGGVRQMSWAEFKDWVRDPANTKRRAAGARAANTEDAGQELWYNRRNRTGAGLQWADVSELNDTLKVKEVVKSKVWPRPDYEQLVADGLRPEFAHLVKQVYDTLATKPQVRGVPTDQQLQDYIETVGQVRDAVFSFVRDNSRVGSALNNAIGQAAALRGGAAVSFDTLTARDDSMLDAVFPKAAGTSSRWRTDGKTNENNARANLVGANKLVGALQVNADNFTAAIKAVADGWPAPQEAWQRIYKIRQYSSGWAVSRAGRTVARELPSKAEAEGAAKAHYEQARKTGEGGVAAEARAVEEAKRVGPDHRRPDEDISSERLMETFGFRGVNFGNWMKGDSAGKRRERQLHLNHAYDALLDLADITGLPPKAISLEGKLGLAFGAQGSGSGSAHFAPGVNEINLTRRTGAGGIAHEWAHALDHYFATLAGDAAARAERPYLTQIGRNTREQLGVRPEIAQAFQKIVNAMEKRPLTQAELDQREARSRAYVAEQLDAALLRLRNLVPDDETALATFDDLATRLRAGDQGEGRVPTGRKVRGLRPRTRVDEDVSQVAGQLLGLLREHGVQPEYVLPNLLDADARSNAVAYQVQQAEQRKGHVPQTGEVSSSYLTEARALESKSAKRGSGQLYWSTPWELFARAFESYVIDRMAGGQRRNDYLSWPQMSEDSAKAFKEAGLLEGDRYPRGAERARINEGFDTLLGEIQTRDAEGGHVALFSRPAGDRGGAPQGLDFGRAMQLKQELTANWGENAPRVVIVESAAGFPASAKADPDHVRAEGFYDGQPTVWINAGAIQTEQRFAQVLAHEAVGHYGVERVVGAEQWTGIVRDIARAERRGTAHKTLADTMADVRRRYGHEISDDTFARETIAVLAERGVSNTFTERMVAAVRRFLRQLMPGLRWTDGDIRDLLSRADSFLRQGRTAAERQAAVQAYAFSRRGWNPEFPDVVLGHQQGTAQAHPDYAAAKAGDDAAALRLAGDLVTEEYVQAIRDQLPEGAKPTLVPVLAEEGAGQNRIPHAVGRLLAQRLGLPLTTKIQQGSKVSRGGSDGFHRLSNPPTFTGEVAPGDYLILDDTLTQGGTLAQLKTHIEDAGGRVLLASALTGKAYSATMALDPAQLAQLRERYGSIESWWRREFGYGFEGLTESEGRFLLKLKGSPDADALRARVDAARVRGLGPVDAGATGPGSAAAAPGSAGRPATAGRDASAVEGQDSEGDLSGPGPRSGLFSRPPAELLGEVTQVMDGLQAEGVLARARQLLADWTPKKLKDASRPSWLGALTLRHLVELGSDYFREMRHYGDDLAAMQADRNLLQAASEELAERARKWASKNRAEARRLFDLMHEATIDGVDPSEAYKPLQFRLGGKLVEATEKNVREGIQVLREVMRGRGGDSKKNMLDKTSQLNAMRKAEPRRRRQYAPLVDKWNQLSPEAQQLYRDFRDAYRERSDAVEEALVKRIEDLKGDGVSDQQVRVMVLKLREQFETNRLQGVYFPLQRFGRYFVAAEKGDTSTFMMFESQNEQERAAKDLAGRGWKITSSGLKADAKAKDAPPGSFVADVIGELKKAGVGDKTQDAVYQVYLQYLPELSTRKHQIHRKAVPGFDPDAVRAFAYSMTHGAHQLARLRYSHKLQATIDMLQRQQDEKRKAPGADVRKIASGDAVLAELNRRHDWVMNPTDSALTNLVSSFGFTYYLGATPAASLVNLTQTALVSYPYLASRYGAVKAMNYLLAAGKDAVRTVGNIQRTLTDPDEQRAHAALMASGALDKTQAHNLAGIAEGGLAGYNPAWAKAMYWIGWGFHKTEVVNREATALAAYRLARAEGESFDKAVKFAHDAVFDTHFDYSNANRARFMQSGTAKVLLMFRQYSLNMTWLLGRSIWQATKAETPEVRRLARRQLAGILGMSALFSGALGLPMVGTAMGVLNALQATFGDDDEPWDAETEFRAFLAAHLGPRGAALIAHGPTNALTGADIAGRVGLSDLWIRDADRELEGRGMYYHLLEQAAGPMGGVLKNVLVGKQMIDEGHLMRGVETMLPKALKDMLKAGRYAVQGVNTLRGDPLVEDLGVYGNLLQAAGFTPAQVARQYERNRDLSNYQQHILDRRQALIDGFAMAMRLDDTEGRAAVLQRIRAFNQANPEVAISAGTITRSMQARARYSAKAEAGIVLNPKLSARLQASVAPLQ